MVTIAGWVKYAIAGDGRCHLLPSQETNVYDCLLEDRYHKLQDIKCKY